MSFAPCTEVVAKSDIADQTCAGRTQGKTYAASLSSELWRLPDDGLGTPKALSAWLGLEPGLGLEPSPVRHGSCGPGQASEACV